MKEKVLFSERKLLLIIVIPFIISLVITLPFLLVSLVRNELNFILFFIFIIFVLMIPLLLFYRFQITVYEKIMVISFGTGLIKKKFLLSDVDKGSFSLKKIPWYYGVGWRYDFKGNVLFNGSPGIALTFKLKESEKEIMIVTKSRESLKDAILNATQN